MVSKTAEGMGKLQETRDRLTMERMVRALRHEIGDLDKGEWSI